MSKTKRNGGYYLADLSGVVLDPATLGQEQEMTHSVVAGIKEALKNNKPILFSNLKIKVSSSSFDVSPIECAVFSSTANVVTAMFGVYSIRIEKDGDTDYATVALFN